MGGGRNSRLRGFRRDRSCARSKSAVPPGSPSGAENVERALTPGAHPAVARPSPDRRRAVVVTLDQTDDLREDGVDVEVVPAWRFLD